MKTTVDIPQEIFEEAVKYTGANTKKDAIVMAVTGFNQSRKLELLAKQLSMFDGFPCCQALNDIRNQDTPQ